MRIENRRFKKSGSFIAASISDMCGHNGSNALRPPGLPQFNQIKACQYCDLLSPKTPLDILEYLGDAIGKLFIELCEELQESHFVWGQ